jgi:hypothetical protein
LFILKYRDSKIVAVYFDDYHSDIFKLHEDNLKYCTDTLALNDVILACQKNEQAMLLILKSMILNPRFVI